MKPYSVCEIRCILNASYFTNLVLVEDLTSPEQGKTPSRSRLTGIAPAAVDSLKKFVIPTDLASSACAEKSARNGLPDGANHRSSTVL
jgi:hypothetical protein